MKAASGRGVKFGRKPKLTPQQITHARKLIDSGERRENVAALLNVDRTTLIPGACNLISRDFSQLWVHQAEQRVSLLSVVQGRTRHPQPFEVI